MSMTVRLVCSVAAPIRRSRKRVSHYCLLLVAWLSMAAICRAEYPALQSAMRPAVTALGKSLEGHSALVAVRDTTNHAWPWRLRGAIQSEVVAQLRSQGIEASDAELEPAMAWLSRGTEPLSSSDLRRGREALTTDHLVAGQLQRDGNSLLLRLIVLRRDSERALTTQSVRLAANDVVLIKNIPELNQKVISYLRERVGTTIGDGQCWTPASEAVKYAGGKRTGTYMLGREMADHEALMPGDILQMEQAKFLSIDGKRRAGMSHHTAIVDEIVQPNVVRILQQNFGRGEKAQTLTTFTLHLDELRSGTLVPFRPADDTASLPWRISPRRRSPPQVVKDAAGRIDLLKTVDPSLDSVRGIWHRWEGPLTVPMERYAQLQIPVDAPPAYVIDAEVTRANGEELFGFGLIVGGRQVLLLIDGLGGEITGLHRLDGKRANANASTRKGKLLPTGQKVQLQVRVTPDSVRLSADGKPVLDWTGDPERLSLDPNWEAPRKDRLFLACYETKILISSLILTPIAVE